MTDRAWLREVRNEYAKEAEIEQARYRRHKIEQLVQSTQIGREFEDATFASYRPQNDSQTAALRATREFAQAIIGGTCRSWLVLIGPVGVGKTHLIAATIKALAEHQLATSYHWRDDYLGKLKRMAYAKDSEMTTAEAVRRLAKAPLVALDDFGARISERTTDEDRAILGDLLHLLHQERHPTIISTNHPLESRQGMIGLDKLLSGPLLSRTRQLSQVVVMRGDDYRPKEG